MDRQTLDDRCAELKARMLAGRRREEASQTPAAEYPAPRQTTKHVGAVGSASIDPEVGKRTRIRNPHPLVKDALAAIRNVPEDYGKLQFRRSGYLDVRVSKSLAQRALAIMDAMLKRAEACGLKVQLAARERSYYQGLRQYTHVADQGEQVQITVTEKTYQRANPEWKEESRYSVPRYIYDPSGRLSLVLDDESYGWEFDCPRKWSDAKGHTVEEFVDDALSSIREVLQSKRQARLRIEEQRQREAQLQVIRAEEARQQREEEARFEELKRSARNWRECERLRAFVSAWELRMEAQHGQIEPGSAADGWRQWALLAISQIDPLAPESP